MFRVLGAVPPIIGACFIRDLGRITDYTGVTGFALAFVFPGLLQRESRRRLEMKRGEGQGDNMYSMGCGLSGDRMANIVTGFGLFLMVFVLGSLMMGD